MRLNQTKDNWEQFARLDPLWAILTEDNKKSNRWSPDEFFQTGVDTIDAELHWVKSHCPDLQLGSALDFGCGVGRLSQALARHFREVTGIDISAGMLEHARNLNRHETRVRYMLNMRADLRLLESDRFDFVYSLITLQHMKPVYAKRYIAEFVRVTARRGVILFQLPSKIRLVRKRRPFTLWPDTLLKRIYRDLRRKIAPGPVMEMYAIPRTEVEATLQAAGAEILDMRRHDITGDQIESWAYLARKR